jgi:hypothetical protein
MNFRPEAVMRGRLLLLIALSMVPAAAPEAALAQFSPGGVIGTVTAPLRHMFGRFGHFPRHRAREARSQRAAAAPPASQQTSSPFGVVGPAAWPTAYVDVVGYTFWPADYAEQVRGRGFDVIAESIAPQDAPRSARVATTGTAVPSEAATEACNEPADSQGKWPASRIEQTSQISNAQHDMLDKLQVALQQAATTIRDSCRDTTSMAPRERLHMLVQQLWAVRDADTFVRAPLRAFYDSLNETQKAAFVNQPQPTLSPDARTANADMGRRAQACAARTIGDSERMIKRIEQTIRPTKQQSAGLETLRKTSSDMAKLLTASCAQPVPTDPLGRLDDAASQLIRMNYAATSMEIALNGFYAQLDDQQKAKFNSLGR